MSQQITLRPFQEQIVQQCRAKFRDHRKVICVAPTGSGKRIMATWWAGNAAGKGARLLVVTNRRTLVWQMRDEMHARHVPYGLIMADEPENRDAPIQVASIQTLKMRAWRDVPTCDGIIVDECHQAPEAYRELFERCPTAKVLGLTATPVGPGGYTLLGDWDVIVEGVKNSELIQQGFLLPTMVLAPSEPSTKGVKLSSKTGEFNQTSLGKRVEECTVFADVFQEWEKHRGLKTIVFAPLVKFARGLCEQFMERGVQAAIVDAKTSKGDRREIFDQFIDQGVDVLVSVDVLREGFDAPVAQCGIDLQPNNQFRTYWQKVGRIKRPHPGQTEAVWLDFAGNYWKFIHPNDDPDWAAVTGDVSTQDVIAANREHKPKPWSCPVCFYTLPPGQKRGPVCPSCQTPVNSTEFIRRVRFDKGEIREVKDTKKRAPINKSADEKKWVSCLYRAMHSQKNPTMNLARFLFKKETGKWPKGFKNCPEYDSGDWKRNVVSVCPWMNKRGDNGQS